MGSSRRVCVGCRVWGVVTDVRRERLWRASVGDWAGGGGPCQGPGAARDGGPLWAAGSGAGREGQGWGQSGGVWGWVCVCLVGVRVRLQRRAGVVPCRPGGAEEKLAVCCGRGKDVADECACLVHLLLGGGKRVL